MINEESYDMPVTASVKYCLIFVVVMIHEVVNKIKFHIWKKGIIRMGTKLPLNKKHKCKL